jgi:hypothetical protein
LLPHDAEQRAHPVHGASRQSPDLQYREGIELSCAEQTKNRSKHTPKIQYARSDTQTNLPVESEPLVTKPAVAPNIVGNTLADTCKGTAEPSSLGPEPFTTWAKGLKEPTCVGAA